ADVGLLAWVPATRIFVVDVMATPWANEMSFTGVVTNPTMSHEVAMPPGAAEAGGAARTRAAAIARAAAGPRRTTMRNMGSSSPRPPGSGPRIADAARSAPARQDMR